ncbi:hypothetical protein B0H16DRAFT_1335095, partial [Mycena metata]
TRFKEILFVANIFLPCYSLCALVFSLLTYFHTLKNARILLVANTSELALSTLAAAFALFVSLIGYPDILLNNRPFLAVYTAFGLLVVPGYITYKRRTLNLEAKVNQQWSQELGAAGRLTIREKALTRWYIVSFGPGARLCGVAFLSSFLLPVFLPPSLHLDSTSLFLRFLPRVILTNPNMAAGLLCSNHVTYRFGKGMTHPEWNSFRLD